MIHAYLGPVKVGDSCNTVIMGVINMSPESFYTGSVCRSPDDAVGRARKMLDEGAGLIDIGGMSTAPYLKTEVSASEEIERVIPVIKKIKCELGCTVSIDTTRLKVAQAAFRAGADILNDVTGLKGEGGMAKAAADASVSVVLGARESSPGKGPPVLRVLKALGESLTMVREAGIDRNKVVVDPAIGFFRETGLPWYVWDLHVLSNLHHLKVLGHPLLVAVSRKSFIGRVTSTKDPERRLFGSIGAEAVSVALGADVIRTHNVAESAQAAKVARKLRPSGMLELWAPGKTGTPRILEVRWPGTDAGPRVRRDSSKNSRFRAFLVYDLDPNVIQPLSSEFSQVGAEFFPFENMSGSAATLLVSEGQVESLIRRSRKHDSKYREFVSRLSLVLHPSQ